MKTHDVIYVPGIGDDTKGRQNRLIQVWKLFGVTPHTFELPWDGQEAFEPKLRRLLDFIDELHAKSHKVSLVGASAGAGAVVNAFAARKDKVTGVICIAGKINDPEAIGDAYRRRSVAFIESANQVPASLKLLSATELGRIQSRHALFDPIVPRKDSIIAGANNKTVPSIGHVVTIAAQLYLGAPFYIAWLKSLAKRQAHKR